MTLDSLPSYIVIHIAGNDIGKTRFGFLVYKLKRIISCLSLMLPKTMLIWSQILPRRHWRFSNNGAAMERLRRRLNSTIGAHTRRWLHTLSSQFLLPDGVHLTSLGNEIFLNNLQCGLEQIILSNEGGIAYP